MFCLFCLSFFCLLSHLFESLSPFFALFLFASFLLSFCFICVLFLSLFCLLLHLFCWRLVAERRNARRQRGRLSLGRSLASWRVCPRLRQTRTRGGQPATLLSTAWPAAPGFSATMRVRSGQGSAIQQLFRGGAGGGAQRGEMLCRGERRKHLGQAGDCRGQRRGRICFLVVLGDRLSQQGDRLASGGGTFSTSVADGTSTTLRRRCACEFKALSSPVSMSFQVTPGTLWHPWQSRNTRHCAIWPEGRGQRHLHSQTVEKSMMGKERSEVGFRHELRQGCGRLSEDGSNRPKQVPLASVVPRVGNQGAQKAVRTK